MDIAIHGSDYGRDILSLHWFVVRVRAVPDSGPGLGVTQLEIKGHAGRQSVSGDFPEIIQTSPEDVVTASVTAQGIDVLISVRLLKLSEQDIANHFGRRLRPSLIFVRAHRLAIGGVDDVVVSIQVRRCDRPEQQCDAEGSRIRSRSRSFVAGYRYVLELALPV